VRQEEVLSTLELVPILKMHRPFAVLASLGLAGLYAEEGWASYALWSHRTPNEAAAIVIAIVLIALIGYLISFFVPPMRVNENWNYPRPWGVFSTITAMSGAITVVFNIIIYILLLSLVDFDLTASYMLLRDIYVYTALGLLFFHGFLLYIRYMHYLYSVPGFVQPMKVIAVSAGSGLVLLAAAGFLFLLDLYHWSSAPVAVQPIMGLHIYVRAIYALTLALTAYAWHFRWIADH
jgi:hypothetical protein